MSIASDGAWAADTMPNELDGFNVWEALTTGKESPRTELELVHNYYDSSATWGSAIRVGRVEADLWPSKSAMVSAVWKCIACSADEKSTAEVRQLPYQENSSSSSSLWPFFMNIFLLSKSVGGRRLTAACCNPEVSCCCVVDKCITA